jgi:hypothetical protein
MVFKPIARHFSCPNCNALYHRIKVEAGPEIVDCLACGGPLPGRDGSFVLKYFLLRKALRPDGRARPGSQAGETNGGLAANIAKLRQHFPCQRQCSITQSLSAGSGLVA